MSQDDAELLEFLREEFFQAATLELVEWEEGALRHERTPSDEELKNLRRLIHSLKGASQAIGFPDLAQALHDLENWLEAAEKAKTHSQVTSVLLDFVDQMRDALRALQTGADPTLPMSEMRRLTSN